MGLFNYLNQIGHFKFGKLVFRLCANKEFTKKYNKLNFNPVILKSVIEKTGIIVLYIINHNTEFVIFKDVDIGIKTVRYVKIIYVSKTVKNFLNEFEAVKFVLNNIYEKSFYGVSLTRRARF
jgi:hypothetical protein